MAHCGKDEGGACMTVLRIFISYETTDAAFATQLMTDLREAGAEVVTDNVGLEDTTFEQFLSEQLPLCQYLIMIQTPAALQSPRVRAVMDSALKLVQEGKMTAVLRVIAPTLKGAEAQALPLRWANTPEFDASQDYARASVRLRLQLELSYTKGGSNAPPPASPMTVLSSSDPQGIGHMIPMLGLVDAQKLTGKDRPHRPLRRSYALLSWRFILPALAIVLVLAGVFVFIYQRTTTLGTAPTPTPTVEAMSFLQPALAVFNNQSYMAWTGIHNHLNIASSSTGTTFTSPTVLSETSSQGPALTVFNSQLYMAWTGADTFLNIASSSDGRTFATPIKLGFTSIHTPALTVFNNQLYIAWIGIDKRLYIASSSDGSTFATPGVLAISSEKAPALTVFNNQLYTAWTDTDNSLHIVRFLNATTFTGVDTPGATSSQGIALTVFRNQLYAAWTGADQGSHLNIANSSTGTGFTPPTILSETSSQAPALVVFNNQLYMAWTGADHRINVIIPG